MNITEAKTVLEMIGLSDEVTDELVDASGIVLDYLSDVETKLGNIPAGVLLQPTRDQEEAAGIAHNCGCETCNIQRSARGWQEVAGANTPPPLTPEPTPEPVNNYRTNSRVFEPITREPWFTHEDLSEVDYED